MSTIGVRFFVDFATHPLEYSKFLIQIGHEPFPPYPARNLLGREVMMLPNCFTYIRYIKSIDGWFGLYRGVVPKLIGRVTGATAALAAVDYLKLDKNVEPLSDVIEMSEEEKISIFKTILLRDIVGKTVSVLVSHPLLVISNRMMAQFVGGEDTYSGMFSSIVAVVKEQGITGFYSGVIPRWFGEMLFLCVSSVAIYFVNNYLFTDKEIKPFTTPVVQYAVNAVVYQFQVITSCMSVNNCGLQAGLPPHMPLYRNWWSCRQHLSLSDQLFRGSSPIFRQYKGPASGFKYL